MSIDAPPPSAEQLADWKALIERIRQGDRSQLLAWDEAEAVGTAAPYQVLVTQLVHRRLRGVPPLLAGSLAGIIAVLRVDLTEAGMILRRRRLGDAGWTVSFGIAQGLLTYWVLPIVVLLDLTGRNDQEQMAYQLPAARHRPSGHRGRPQAGPAPISAPVIDSRRMLNG